MPGARLVVVGRVVVVCWCRSGGGGGVGVFGVLGYSKVLDGCPTDRTDGVHSLPVSHAFRVE